MTVSLRLVVLRSREHFFSRQGGEGTASAITVFEVSSVLVLMRNDATVTICHSHTQDLASITRSADILVVSIGRPASITADMVKSGAVVLDAGINPIDGKVVGDIDFENVKDVASFLTPVPGGLGPLTHLMLIRHTLLGPQ